MTGKMALIGETDMEGSFADGELACGQKSFAFSPWPRRHTGKATGR